MMEVPMKAIRLALAAVFLGASCAAQTAPGWTTLLMYHTYTASSTLGGDDFFSGELSRYTARNMNDGSTSTCWAEGAAGPGTGQRIYIAIEGRPSALSVVNGYAKSKALYRKNGRVRRFEVSLLHAFNLRGDVTEVATQYHCIPSVEKQAVDLRDAMERQSFPLTIDWAAVQADAGRAQARFDGDFKDEIARRREGTEEPGYRQALILCLEIVEAYPGSQFDDTCVSELTLE
jgi:hypothetical protein